MKTCTFTGHRANKLPWKYDETDSRCISFKEKLDTELRCAYNEGYKSFICGMADGGDLYFGEAVASLKDEFPDIQLEAAVPFKGFINMWGEDERYRFERLLEACDQITYLDEVQNRGSMMKRNRYMVDHSDLVFTYFLNLPGGTLNTLRYAAQKGRKIIHLS